MAKQNINVGTKANDKAGDPLRTAFTKINDNFTELYTLTGGTSTALTELAQDYAAPMFNHASHTNITVTYDDANNKILLTGAAAQVQSNWTASSGLAVILNKPTLFSGSYTDLTNKPTIPTSFSSLVNGEKTVSLSSSGNLTLPSGLTFRKNGTPYSTITADLDKVLQIETQTSGGVKQWSLGTDGSLTFPDGYLKIVPNGANPYISNRTDNGLGLVSGSAIQIRQSVADAYGITIDSSITSSLGGGSSLASGSSIDVNGSKIVLGSYDVNYADANTGLTALNKIEINNNDILIGQYVSTLAGGTTTSAFVGWTFNKYGTTTFPTNISINYSGGNVQFPRIIADSGKAFSVQGQGTSGSAALSWTVNPAAAGQYAAVAVSRAGGGNLAKVILQAQSDSGNVATAKLWKFDETGNLTFPDNTTQTGKSITVPVDQAFDFNFSQTVPSGTSKISINNSGVSTDLTSLLLTTSGNKRWTLNSADKRIEFSDSTAIIRFGTATKNGTGASNDIELFAYGADNGAGSVYISAGSTPTNNRWKFDASGRLTFPNNTVQTTAWTGIPGPYADDEAATLAGVALGSPYHKTGTGGQVFVRLTSPT